MEPQPERRPRGRPRIITREAIAEAGRRLTLPRLTMADLADELGVGIRSLYKHTNGILDVHVITAEEIFARWQAPPPGDEGLERHLLEVSLSLRRLALENPGIARFLIRNSQDISPRVLQAMDAHQQSVARAYDLPLSRASLVLAAVAEHTLAVTDAVHSDGGRLRDRERMAGNTELAAISAAARETAHRTDEDFFVFGVRALIHGLITITESADEIA